MTYWQIVYGSQDVKPAEFDTTSSAYYVYQRRNVRRVTTEDEFGTSEFWQYDERKLTKDEYNALRAELLKTELTNTQLALVDLYESLLEG